VAKKITWTVPARADLGAIDQRIAMNILHALARFTQTGTADVERDPPEFRLRVGDYRVRSHDYGDNIEILKVRHRSEAYR
jgi:mRNA-degrading endonuclease RelE of RelBE toxin-antitoxin system